MDKSGIAKRYASAIYDIAKSSNKISEIREVLSLMMEKYEEEEEFKKYFNEVHTYCQQDFEEYIKQFEI